MMCNPTKDGKIPAHIQKQMAERVMKECKCGRIPPCCGGKKFRIHEELEKMPRVAPLSEETAQETIKTLEAFSKSLEAELKACELMNLIYEDIEKSIKRNDMEEKKTKKMTKVEAFGYLMHKKVACYNRKEVDIQKKLFEIGFKWCDGTTVEVVGMFEFLLIDDGTFQFTDNVSHFRKHAYEEIEMDDILSIEIVDDKKDDERKGEILDEIAKLGEKISDLIEEYEGDIIIEIDQYEVLLRDSGDILYRK